MTRVQAIVEEMVRDEGVTGAVRLGYHDRLLAAHRADLEEALGGPAYDEMMPLLNDKSLRFKDGEQNVLNTIKSFIASRRKRYIP